jgi:radical SAM protein with 4Fe4S-binding SPASM domain
MRFFLSNACALKRLETPSVYNIETDELYDLDEESFEFLKECSSEHGGCSDSRDFTDYCLGEGILVTEGIPGRRPPLMKSPFPSLRYLELQITHTCNLNCRHCYIGEKENDELSTDEIKKVLQEFEKMQGLRLLITGGEPLLHSRFAEINDMLPAFSFRKVLFTNGTLLKGEIIEGLNVDEIQISIDGLEDSHDLLRGRGTFHASLLAAKSCLAKGFAVSISTMVHSANLKDFDAMEKLFREMGVKDWTVDVPCMAGRMKRNRELMISPGEGGRYLAYGYGGGIHAGEPGFACGLHLMSVSAKGEASKCTFYSDSPAGNVADGLATCWQTIAPVRLADLRCDCRHLENCRGGCRYRAEVLEGPLGRDLYRCAMYDIIGSGDTEA